MYVVSKFNTLLRKKETDCVEIICGTKRIYLFYDIGYMVW